MNYVVFQENYSEWHRKESKKKFDIDSQAGGERVEGVNTKETDAEEKRKAQETTSKNTFSDARKFLKR